MRKWGSVAQAESTGGMEGINWHDVGGRIAQARKAEGFTQAALGVAITTEGDKAVHLVTISNYESKGEPIPWEKLEAIAAQVRRSVRWLLFGDVVPLDVEAIIARAKSEAFQEAAALMESKVVQLRGTAYHFPTDQGRGAQLNTVAEGSMLPPDLKNVGQQFDEVKEASEADRAAGKAAPRPRDAKDSRAKPRRRRGGKGGGHS